MGNRTECALLLMLRDWGEDYKQLRAAHQEQVVEVYGFSSERKMASVLIRQEGGGLRLYNKVITPCMSNQHCIPWYMQYQSCCFSTAECSKTVWQSHTTVLIRACCMLGRSHRALQGICVLRRALLHCLPPSLAGAICHSKPQWCLVPGALHSMTFEGVVGDTSAAGLCSPALNALPVLPDAVGRARQRLFCAAARA